MVEVIARNSPNLQDKPVLFPPLSAGQLRQRLKSHNPVGHNFYDENQPGGYAE